MQKSKIYTLLLFLFFSLNIQAQIEDLKYLEDDGYSEIRNQISIDLVQLITPAISIRYDRLLGKYWMASIGVKIINPNKEQEFIFDFMGVYSERNREFYPKSPGINYFVEMKSRLSINNSFLILGLGYRNQRYDVGQFHDIYIPISRSFDIGTRFNFSVGLDFGVRLIRYTDIVFDSRGATGFILDLYKDSYEQSLREVNPIFRPTLNVGYMF